MGGLIGDEEGLDIIWGFIIQGMIGKNHYLISDSGVYQKPLKVYEVQCYMVSFSTFNCQPGSSILHALQSLEVNYR